MLNNLPGENRPRSSGSSDFGSLSIRTRAEIDVDSYAAHYDVADALVLETLRTHPVLCYLLGRVSPLPSGKDTRPDGTERDIFLLEEGSGLFNLGTRDDALRWKGIFNHIAGSSRHVWWLANELSKLSLPQRQEFKEFGFAADSVDQIDPHLLRDFMLISHAGRRQSDEHNWHGLRDNAHPSGNSELNTRMLLSAAGADPRFIYLLKVEDHQALLEDSQSVTSSDLSKNILCWCDWTFAQKPLTIRDRFAGLRSSRRADPHILDLLEAKGLRFQRALENIIGPGVFEKMIAAPIPDWERNIRLAYCAASGLQLREAFPAFGSGA